MDQSWVSVDEPVEIAAAYELVVERIRRAIHLGQFQLAEWIGWHRQLLAAIEAGDAGRAARAMRLHVDRNRSEILALLGVGEEGT
jgi:DNA-binding GntR family transcriptional regulator